MDLRKLGLKHKILIVAAVLLGAFIFSVLKDLGYETNLLAFEVPFQNKLVHFFGAGAFGALATLFSKSRVAVFGVRLSPLVIALLVLSVLEEVSQIYRPHRGFSFADMLANLLGILAFAFTAQQLLNRKAVIC